MYDALHAFIDNPETRYEQFFLDICRQFGKTFIGVNVATEYAIRNPGWRILYTSATRAGLWQFVQPNISTLLVDCPPDLAPRWNTTDASYHFPNGAQIHLAGVNAGHENDARGPRANLVINEESAFVDRLDYLVSSIELPMLTTTGGRIVHITTRPETPAHEVMSILTRCKMKGNYISRTLDEVTHLSEAAREKLIEEAGGRDSTTAARELFCKTVTDATRAIVPEYTEALDAELAATEPPPPTYEQPTVAMDVGFEDFHHILFGYYDFNRAKRVIQAEVRLQRATTDKIATAIRETEAQLWMRDGKFWTKNPVRYSDTDLRLIADLNELHKLPFIPTEKDDKEAQVNALRISIKGKGWHISPGCVALRRQLRLGVWNKQRTEFDRSREDGHFDAVDAAIYWNRSVDRYTNPYPAHAEGVTWNTHHLRNVDTRTPAAKKLENVFRRRN